MDELKASLTRRANIMVEQRKREVAQSMLAEAVGTDAGSLTSYTELGWYEHVGFSEQHPEGVVYHKIRNIAGIMDRDAYELARKEANKREHNTVLIGAGAPLSVAPLVKADDEDETPDDPDSETPAEPEVSGGDKAKVLLKVSGKRMKVGVEYNGQWMSIFMPNEKAKAFAHKLQGMSPTAAYKLFKKTAQTQKDKEGSKKEVKEATRRRNGATWSYEIGSLSFPWKANKRHEDLDHTESKKGHRTLGGDQGDLWFGGYNVDGNGTELVDVVLRSSLSLSSTKAREVATSIVDEAHDSIGPEAVEHS